MKPKVSEWEKEFSILFTDNVLPNGRGNDLITTKEDVEPLMNFIQQTLDQQKAEMVEMVREQERKMKASKWLHGMGLSGSQAEFIEANVVASLDDIIKRLEGE